MMCQHLVFSQTRAHLSGNGSERSHFSLSKAIPWIGTETCTKKLRFPLVPQQSRQFHVT